MHNKPIVGERDGIREIILDTETTGLSTVNGDRIVEIACLELINRDPTGNVYHQYINPEREMSAQAEMVHGISSDFLRDKPTMRDVIDDFLRFVGNDTLVIHNARFDISFLNYELELLSRPPLTNDVVDTLMIAKQKYPTSPASLDALCKRFEISLAARDKHGALIDCELLAKVYWHLLGVFNTCSIFDDTHHVGSDSGDAIRKVEFNRRKVEISDDELALHHDALQRITNPLWEKFM